MFYENKSFKISFELYSSISHIEIYSYSCLNKVLKEYYATTSDEKRILNE